MAQGTSVRAPRDNIRVSSSFHPGKRKCEIRVGDSACSLCGLQPCKVWQGRELTHSTNQQVA